MDVFVTIWNEAKPVIEVVGVIAVVVLAFKLLGWIMDL